MSDQERQLVAIRKLMTELEGVVKKGGTLRFRAEADFYEWPNGETGWMEIALTGSQRVVIDVLN